MTDESKTIWGIPVVESDQVPDGELWAVVGSGVIRQDGTLEWDEDSGTYRLTNIGEPYDPYAVDSRKVPK